MLRQLHLGCHQTIPRAVYHASLGRRVASRAGFKFTTHKYLSLWCQLCGGSVRVDREVAAEAGEEERAIIRLFVRETEVRSVKATINYTIPTPEECLLGDGDAEEVVPDGEVMNIGVVGGSDSTLGLAPLLQSGCCSGGRACTPTFPISTLQSVP